MWSRTDLHESWYRGCVLKFVDAFQFRSQSDTTWRSSYFYGYFRYVTMVIVVYKAISTPVVSFVAIFPSVNVDFLLTVILLLLWLSWLPGLSLSLVAFFLDYVKASKAFRYMDVLILLFLGLFFFFSRSDSTDLCTCGVGILFLGLTGTQSPVTITAIFLKWVS